MTTIKKNYDLVDLLKLIGSVLIVAMHMSALSDFNTDIQFYGIELLSRWGVPFYFVTSSFFLFLKAENGNISREQLIRYIKRILLLYTAWFVINIPYVIYSRLLVKDITSVETWLLFFKNSLVSSTFLGSWYLVSCVFSSWFIYTLAKRMSTKKILLFTFLIYLFCIVTSAYSGLFPQPAIEFLCTYIFSPYNSLICGCFFFAMGKYIAEKKDQFPPVSFPVSLILLVVFYALYYLEIFILKQCHILGETDAAFLLIPLAFWIVLLCVRSNCKLKYTNAIRKTSTIIYCSQGIVILTAKFVCKFLLRTEHSFIEFFIASAIMCIMACVILLLQKHGKFKWMSYLT